MGRGSVGYVFSVVCVGGSMGCRSGVGGLRELGELCGAVLAGTVAMVVEEGRGEGWLSQARRYLGCERKYMWEAQLVLTISVGLAGTGSRSLFFCESCELLYMFEQLGNVDAVRVDE